MSTTDLLTSLPTAICCCILGNWVDMKSLVTLDSAYCSNSYRKAILTLLQELNVREPLTPTNQHWFYARKLPAENIITRGGMDEDQCKSYLSRFGSAVRSVEFAPGSVPAVMSLVASHCHHLTAVHEENGDFITPEFRELLESNPLLEVLRCVSLRTYDQGNVQDRNTASFKGIQLPKLHTMSLNHTRCTSEQMCEALQMSSGILRLQVGAGWFRPSAGSVISRIAEYCPQIRALSLPNWDDDIDDGVVATITSACHKIEHLDLETAEISDAAFLSITHNLHGLRSLNIQRCHELTSTSIQLLNTHYADTLECLFLTRSSDSGPLFEPSEVSTLFRRCTRLRTLGWMEEINYGESALLLPAAVSDLTSVVLGWDALCDANLLTIGQHCANLRTLALYLPHASHSMDERKYTHVGITALLQGCLCLQKVYIDVPMHFQATPHPSSAPITDLITSLRPDITVYWKPADEKIFAYDALNMPL